jgi:HD-GYP domain-containing protein (c-di-GMP phosphodiesterase class II)
MAYLKAEDLKPGMKLKSDFINERGRLFLAEGTVLTDNLIKRINELSIPYISIVQDTDAKETAAKHKTQYEIETENFMQIYKDTHQVVKKLSEDVRFGRRLSLDGIRETVGTFIDLVFEDHNIIPKLQQIHMTDEYTYYHSMNVGVLTILIGKWLKMPHRDMRKLGYAGLFHDIGKCRIPLEILNKPDTLDAREWATMKRHPVFGYNILKKNHVLSNDVLMGVLMHHEREDGSGYPLGFKGREIHTYGKIVAVADIFDAMMSDRVYRKKRPPLQVAEYISDRSFDCLDPHISQVFLQGITRNFVGNLVRLNDGRIGKVIYTCPQDHTKPVVLTEGEFLDFSRDKGVTIVEIIG